MIHIPADKKLCDAMMSILTDMGIRCIKGTIASGDQFVASPKEKARISETFNAVVCEMEGGAVGHVCYVNHVPFAVLRAISDGGDEAAQMDYPTFARMAAANSVRVLVTYLTR
jgi:adenosylhomocysteine nucleosidase